VHRIGKEFRRKLWGKLNAKHSGKIFSVYTVNVSCMNSKGMPKIMVYRPMPI
jgi:hypothetical protein